MVIQIVFQGSSIPLTQNPCKFRRPQGRQVLQTHPFDSTSRTQTSADHLAWGSPGIQMAVTPVRCGQDVLFFERFFFFFFPIHPCVYTGVTGSCGKLNKLLCVFTCSYFWGAAWKSSRTSRSRLWDVRVPSSHCAESHTGPAGSSYVRLAGVCRAPDMKSFCMAGTRKAWTEHRFIVCVKGSWTCQKSWRS